MASFEDRVTIERSVEDVFDFFSVTRNHEKISQGHLGVAFTQAPERFEQGSMLHFDIQGFGQTQSVVYEILEFERPERYLEQQVEGPMKQWIHEHLFIPEGDTTIVVDKVRFEPPGGLIGMLLTESRILESLDEGIFSRNQMLKQILEGGAA
ncbi:MAG: hypothetical protein KDA93_15900 [Planctomycetaceae bacterium]|nr:hypothetical protein [Planctomycetaceae bacterium]